MHANCQAHFSELWHRAELNRPRVCCALVTTTAHATAFLPNVDGRVERARMVICLQTGCFLFGERSSTRSSSLQRPDPACPRPAWWNGWRCVGSRTPLSARGYENACGQFSPGASAPAPLHALAKRGCLGGTEQKGGGLCCVQFLWWVVGEAMAGLDRSRASDFIGMLQQLGNKVIRTTRISCIWSSW
jgi:hypothetical protein